MLVVQQQWYQLLQQESSAISNIHWTRRIKSANACMYAAAYLQTAGAGQAQAAANTV